jgi:hypothetical protein
VSDLDIGVIYTHERAMIARLLPTLRDSAGGYSTRLLLVDNATDEDVHGIASVFPESSVIRNETRLAYGANLNVILKASDAPFVLLMNTDMYFDPAEQCLGKMLDFMHANPDCGVAGCQLRHADGTQAYSARRFQRLSTILARRCGLGRWMRGTLDDYFYRHQDMSAAWPCDWLSGCFLLVRRETFDEVGFFDTRFEKYFEDVDFCRRVTQAGWRVMYNGSTYCYHLEQRASKRIFSADARQHARSYLRWLLKWGFATPPPAAGPDSDDAAPARRLDTPKRDRRAA